MPQQQQGQHYQRVLQVTLLSWPYCGIGIVSTQHGRQQTSRLWLLGRRLREGRLLSATAP
jgi:hypothetical protein